MTELTHEEKNLAKKSIYIFGGAFFAFAGIFLLVLWVTYISEQRNLVFGETASGTVLSTKIVYIENDNETKTEKLKVNYLFELPNGNHFKDELTVDSKYQNKLSEGKSLIVKYKSNNPKSNTLVGMEKVSTKLLILGSLFGLLFMFLGFMVIRKGIRSIENMNENS